MKRDCVNNGYHIIIPSAKSIIAEFQNIGELPAIIYPINQKMVFDYLYDQYRCKSEMIKIVCYEQADKVRQYLSKYENKGLIIEELPVLGDLGYSVYYGIRDIKAPIIINFADTIVLDDMLQEKDDACFFSVDFLSDRWTFFEERDGKIVSVQDKELSKSNEKKKLFVGVFKICNTQYFKECLEKAFSNRDRQESSFYCALKEYSHRFPVSIIETKQWFDIGHVENYYNSNLEVKEREFNHIFIDKNRGILKKTSDNKEDFIKEIEWYLKLPSEIEYVRPRIFDYSTSYGSPYVSMEYYAYHTLHELFLYGTLSYRQWVDIFNCVRFVCDDFKRYTVKEDCIANALENMYLSKTLERLDTLKRNKSFMAFFYKPICVNGIIYKSLEQVIKCLPPLISELLFDIDAFHIIHGDLCFTNIMVDSNYTFIKLIDPRGKFGMYDIYGDFRYDLAKLLHSVDGKYDYIIKGLFTISYDTENARISYKFLENKQDYEIYEIFCGVFQDEIGSDMKKIELIEALLFLSMIPLHNEDLEQQMVMLGRGLEILNRVAEIKM